MKKKILAIITIATLIILLFTPMTIADPDNVIEFLPEDIHVELGENITMNINVTIDDPCDTVAVDNMTFDGNVVTTQSANVTSGNLFENGSIDDIVTVDNTNGWIASIVWSNETLSAGTTGTLANITWYASGCGVSQINMTAGGTAYNGTANATVNHSCNITVHPQHPIHMNVNTTGPDTINISWTAGAGADNYTVEVNTTSSSWPRGEGQIANLSSDTLYYVDSELSPSTTYYYQVWSYNSTENLYSLYNNSGSNITDPSPTLATEVNLYGLTDTWNITIENTSYETAVLTPNIDWCNSSGIRNETMEVNMTVNSTHVIAYINVSVDNITDGTYWSNASNVSVWVSGDNTTYHRVQDDDGNGFGVGVDGGNNITINWSTWYGDNDPFINHGDGTVINENCSIWLRFRYEFNLSMNYGTYHNQTDDPWTVWIGDNDEIHDHEDFTVQVLNRNDELDMFNFYPANNSYDISRHPTNFSATITGDNVAVYFSFVNQTDTTDSFETFATFDGVTDERVEFDSTNISSYGTGYEFSWGNTSYTWYVNITDGTTWSNRTLYFHTVNESDGNSLRMDAENDSDVDIFDVLEVYNWYSNGNPYNGFFDMEWDRSDVDIFDALEVYNEYS